MKVCTDACVFGASAPLALPDGTTVASVLDIGTGTGLLSLMYAQQNNAARIDAVEIDEAAAIQAGENFAASPWAQRLTVHHSAIQQFSPAQPYDLVISNPPFFENALKSDDSRRNLALHSEALRIEELLRISYQVLQEQGLLYLLLPYHRTADCLGWAAAQGFFLHRQVSVQQTPQHPFFRSMLCFGKSAQTPVSATICIRDEAHAYTSSFTELLRPFYLYL